MVRRFLVVGSVLLLAACQPGAPPASMRQTTPTPATIQPPTSTPASASAAEVGTFRQACASAQLAITWGGPVSEPTGQNSLALVLANTSKTGCYLFGYPKVVLVDSAERVLPFQYQRSGDQVVTSASPTHVDLTPGGNAYVTINKYRCDTTDLMSTADVLLTPPDQASSLRLAIDGNVALDYCGPGDPGSVVHVSPVEPTYQATWATP